MPEVMIFCRSISIRQMRDVFKIIDGKLMPALSTIEGLERRLRMPLWMRQKKENFYQKMISETGQKSARQSST